MIKVDDGRIFPFDIATLYMLWFKFTSSSNFLNWFIFFKPVYIFQTGSYFSIWVEIFKPV